MAKVRTFSRVFPSYHPKAGQPTFFVEKFYKSLFLMKPVPPELVSTYNFDIMNDDAIKPKHHTVRGGKHFKQGDYFSPRVWSGKPYCSKQIILSSDVQIKQVWDFEIKVAGDYIGVFINDYPFYEENETFVSHTKELETLAQNDGLDIQEFKDWFKWGTPFSGQILCWDENINY